MQSSRKAVECDRLADVWRDVHSASQSRTIAADFGEQPISKPFRQRWFSLAAADDRLAQCRAETDRSQAALSRLLEFVAQGIMSPRDPALAEKLSKHRAHIATLFERANLLERQLNRGGTILTPDLVKRFVSSSATRYKLTTQRSGEALCACLPMK